MSARTLSKARKPLIILIVIAACNFLSTPTFAEDRSILHSVKPLRTSSNKAYIPPEVLQVIVEQHIMSALVNLAQKRYSKYGDINLSLREQKKVNTVLNSLTRYSSSQDEKMLLWYHLARTCYDYEGIGGRYVEANESFVVVFDVVFWECCHRIAKIPGQTAHYVLKDLRKELRDHISSTQMDDIIQSQSTLKPMLRH